MLLNAVALLLTVLYPLAIWFGHGQVEPRWLALLLLLAVACRLPALKLQRAARWSVIHIEFFIFEDDKLSNKLRELLIQKSKEGVRVRMIYDFWISNSRNLLESLSSSKDENSI